MAVVLWSEGAADRCRAADDNALIPDAVLEASAPAAAERGEKPAPYSLVLENVLFSNDWRNPDDLILSGRSTSRANWSDLAQLEFRTEADLGSGSKLVVDSLALAEAAEQRSFVAKRDTHVYFKELYATIAGRQRQYWDFGRIVMRSGVGIGFNPTDYFKTNALISRTSEDPSQLRTNRLGTVALRWQRIGTDSAWSFVVAPEIGADDAGLMTDASVIGQNLHRTNDRRRALLRYAYTADDNLATDVSVYSEDGRPQLGLNLSYSAGQKLLLTFEGNLARRRTLLDEGLANSTVPLSSAIASRFGSEFPYRTLIQANIGGSYTTDDNITTLIEFHYNQAGLDRAESNRYFDAARAATGASGQIPLLLARQQALLRQEPWSRRTLFARVSMPEAIHPDVTLNFLLVRDLEDRSYLSQSEIAWLVSSRVTARLRYISYRGDGDTNYGSNALRSSVLVQLVCAF